jgi:CspA family cold shock protein
MVWAGWRGHSFLNLSHKENNMANGTVKWFNPTKGFGFIAPQDGTSDVFVHISALEKAGLHSLNEGQKVSYEIAMNKGKTAAANLKLAEAA